MPDMQQRTLSRIAAMRALQYVPELGRLLLAMSAILHGQQRRTHVSRQMLSVPTHGATVDCIRGIE